MNKMTVRDISLKGKRVLFSVTLGNTLVAKDVRAAFDQALGKLKDLGAELVELPDDLPNMEPIWKVINHTTWRARFDHLIRRPCHASAKQVCRCIH